MRKRIKRLIKVAVCLLAFCLIVAVGIGWFNYVQLERRIENIRAVGDPVSLADLQPPDVPPEQNAATYLGRVTAESDKLDRELQPLALGEDFSWARGLTDQQAQQAAEAFAAYSSVLESLQRAVECRYCVWPLDYTATPVGFLDEYLQQIGQMRNFARILDARGRYLASTDKPDEAVAAYLQLLRLSRLFDQSPLLISFLTNIAVRSVAVRGLNGILQTSTLSAETREAIERELAEHDDMEGMLHALKTERAYGNESFRSLAGKVQTLTGHWSDYLDLMQRQIEMGTASQAELANVRPTRTDSVLANLVLPAIEEAREAMNRVRAELRCLRILNGIAQHSADGGQVDITQLGLPKPITIDPFTGQPLKVQSTPRGWVIYSVGADGKDNGGQINEYLDVGAAPPAAMSE